MRDSPRTCVELGMLSELICRGKKLPMSSVCMLAYARGEFVSTEVRRDTG